MSRGWLAVALVLGISVAAAWADGAPVESARPDQVDAFIGHHRLHPVFDKLGRGVSNTLFGWLELPATISQRYDTRNTAGSMLSGTAYGIVRGVVRTGVGLYEVVTCVLPYPKDFAPVLPTLAYFDKDQQRRPLPLE